MTTQNNNCPQDQTNLADLIRAAKCRKGTATGITMAGAYWHPIEPTRLLTGGGDGIGNAPARTVADLHIRHYRDGTVELLIVKRTYHQNWGERKEAMIIDPTKIHTTEDLITELRKQSAMDFYCYDEYYERHLQAAMAALHLPDADQSPDED